MNPHCQYKICLFKTNSKKKNNNLESIYFTSTLLTTHQFFSCLKHLRYFYHMIVKNKFKKTVFYVKTVKKAKHYV